MLYLTYDRLFGFGLQGKPIPQLATELPTKPNGGISADGLTWTVHIRPGVKWQDGQPLTAADVAFSYNLIIDNKLTSFLQAVKDIKHAEAVDDTTVRFTMSAPKADMLYAVVYIIPEHIWGKVKVVDARAQLRQQAAHRRQRTVPGDVLQARRLHQARAQPRLLGQRRRRAGGGPRWTRSSSRPTRTPTP